MAVSHLFSWILGSFLVDTFYTTIYTSHLTKPGYNKVINTIDDFIENGKILISFNKAAIQFVDIRNYASPFDALSLV